MDTDHLGVLQHHTSPECTRLMLRMQACSDTDMYVSIISFHEQVLGWNAYLARAKEAVSIARAYQRFQQILADFSESQVLPFDLLAAGLFDEMRAQRVRIGTMDSIGTGQHSQIGHNDRMSNLLAAMRRLARDRVHARAVRLPIAALAVPFFLSAQPTSNVRKAKLAQKESGVKPPHSKGCNHELHE